MSINAESVLTFCRNFDCTCKEAYGTEIFQCQVEDQRIKDREVQVLFTEIEKAKRFVAGCLSWETQDNVAISSS